MNRLTGVIKMHLRDKNVWIYGPWLWGVLPSFVVNVFVSMMLNLDEPYYSGGLSSIYVYMLIVSGIIVSQTFPFAIGLSVRRTDYFLGTAATAVLFAVVVSLVLTLLSLAEGITEAWGWNFYYFRLPYINSGTAVQQAWTIFGILLAILFTGIGIASVYQRFGKIGMLVFFSGSLLVTGIGSVILTVTGMWGELFRWLTAHSAAYVATWLVLFAVCCALLSHWMLRRANA